MHSECITMFSSLSLAWPAFLFPIHILTTPISGFVPGCKGFVLLDPSDVHMFSACLTIARFLPETEASCLPNVLGCHLDAFLVCYLWILWYIVTAVKEDAFRGLKDLL